MNKVLNCLILLLLPLALSGQENVGKEIVNRFNKQLSLFPQEKLYLHTDKNIYVSGERVWFRAYLADAVLHTPSFESRYVYVELLNPLDSVVYRAKIRPVNDCYSGYIPIDEELPGGNYSLRAYTYYMESLPASYFFHKQIRIGNVGYERIGLEKEFNYNAEKGRMYVMFSFPNNENSEKTPSNHVVLRYKNEKLDVRYSNSDRKYRASFYPDTIGSPLYLECGNYKCYQDVPSVKEKGYHVGFYPEGGRLVGDCVCRVGFKALGEDGLGIPVSGYVVDDQGKRQSSFYSLHKGIGSFLFRPVSGRTYYAVCTDSKKRERQFPLPLVENTLPSLKVEDRGGFLYVTMQNSRDKLPDGMSLVLHTRGQVFYADRWLQGNKQYAFNCNMFPSGVLSVLLLDNGLRPVSERLFFCRNNDQATGLLSTGKNSYPLRSQVTNSVCAVDSLGRLQNGWASVSVTRDEEVEPDTCSSMYSYMLLSSDLRGYIEDASYYFRDAEDDTRIEALDALMLTQGWRRYDVPSLLQANYATPMREIEGGFLISGNVRNGIFDKLYEGSKVGLIVPQFNYADIVESDSLGHFSFTGFEFPDSTRYIVQAMKKNGKGISLTLEMDTDIFPSVNRFFPSVSTSSINDYNRYLDNVRDKYPGALMVNLSEVTVLGNQKKDVFVQSFAHNNYSYQTYTDKDIKEGRYNSVFEVLRRINGVRILPDNTVIIGESRKSGILLERGSKSKKPVTLMSKMGNSESESSISGGEKPNPEELSNMKNLLTFKSPLIVLDGVAMENFDLSIVNISDVERLDVYRGVTAVMYGEQGNGGVISITTKGGKHDYNEKEIRDNIQQLDNVLLGYQKSAKFYSPVYTPTQTSFRPDPRTTVYWNPDIRLNNAGDTTFDYYTTDKPGKYTYILEGMTEDGKLIHEEKSIRVEE